MTQTIINTALPEYSEDWAFFLDVDGTLLELSDRPDAVEMNPELLEILGRLSIATKGSVALVSGRSLKDLDLMFSPLRFPMAGQHGAERRDPYGTVHYHHHSEHEALFSSKKGLIARFACERGMLLEDKGLAIALHYRDAPNKGAEAERFMRNIVGELGDYFHLQEGKMVLEIRPSGRDKGIAIEEFMDEAPFRSRLPVFIGDDITDEDGFRVVNRRGGLSIKVGLGATEARWRLDSAAAVLDWIGKYSDFVLQEATRVEGEP